MKNTKKVLAIAGVVVLLILFAMPMIFALGSGEKAQEMFKISIGLVITVPILAYICLMAVRVFGRKQTAEEGAIKNIVFDVGNVLIDFQWKPYLKSFGYSEEVNERLVNAVFGSQVWNERDRGDRTEEEYVQMFVANDPELETEIRAIMKDCPKTVVPFDYADTWVRVLKEQGYHLYILSNFSHYMLDRTRDRLKFLRSMDGILFSCDVNLIKPEPEIYQLLLKRFGLNPAETVFLDDRKDNCEAAEQEGIHAIVFESLKQADAELKKLGVKTSGAN